MGHAIGRTLKKSRSTHWRMNKGQRNAGISYLARKDVLKSRARTTTYETALYAGGAVVAHPRVDDGGLKVQKYIGICGGRRGRNPHSSAGQRPFLRKDEHKLDAARRQHGRQITQYTGVCAGGTVRGTALEPAADNIQAIRVKRPVDGQSNRAHFHDKCRYGCKLYAQ